MVALSPLYRSPPGAVLAPGRSRWKALLVDSEPSQGSVVGVAAHQDGAERDALCLPCHCVPSRYRLRDQDHAVVDHRPPGHATLCKRGALTTLHSACGEARAVQREQHGVRHLLPRQEVSEELRSRWEHLQYLL